MLWIAVGAGGALGSMARHTVNMFFIHVVGRPVPYATATVNIVGSLVIGVLAGLLASSKLQMSVTAQTFVFVGLLGGFTTFSSFMLDTLTLGHGGNQPLAFLNVAGQLGLGLIAIYAGYAGAMLATR